MTGKGTAPLGVAPGDAACVDRAAERAKSTPSRIDGQGDRVVAVIPRGERACIRVALASYKGKLGLDLRLFKRYATTGELGPTARGIRLRLDELEEIRSAVDQALVIVGGERDR